MKKSILAILLIVVIAVAAGVYYVLTNLDALVKEAIETHGSKATQTAVRVDDVSIRLKEGAAAIRGLTIGNPDGFDMPHAFSLGEVRGGIDLQSLQEEPYVINEIAVMSPQVFVEISQDNRTNLNELKKNLAPASSAGSGAGKEPEAAGGAEPRLIIRRIRFEGGTIQARVAALDNREYELKLPGLDMADLGGSTGATATELAREIVSRLTDRATAVVKEKIIDGELEELKARAREKVDEEKAKLEQKIDAEKEEQKQKVEDKLKGLLGR